VPDGAPCKINMSGTQAQLTEAMRIVQDIMNGVRN
jgi:hypothetical protein